MSKNYALNADKRDQAGKGAARSLRRENKTPAVIYGDSKEPVTITLDQNTINVEYNKGKMYTTLCDLEVEGEKNVVLARDVQLHPVTDNVMHVDFLRVTAKTKITVEVPVHFINEDKSPGILDKGVLSVIRHKVELNCSAMNIPEFIEANLEGKEFGDSINISDVIMPEGTSPVIDDRDFIIANLFEPKKIEDLEEELAEGEEGEAVEGEEGAEGEGGEASGDAEGGEKKAEGGEE